MKKKLTNQQKIDLILEDLEGRLCNGDDYSSIRFAFENGYYLWRNKMDTRLPKELTEGSMTNKEFFERLAERITGSDVISNKFMYCHHLAYGDNSDFSCGAINFDGYHLFAPKLFDENESQRAEEYLIYDTLHEIDVALDNIGIVNDIPSGERCDMAYNFAFDRLYGNSKIHIEILFTPIHCVETKKSHFWIRWHHLGNKLGIPEKFWDTYGKNGKIDYDCTIGAKDFYKATNVSIEEDLTQSLNEIEKVYSDVIQPIEQEFKRIVEKVCGRK